MPLFKAFKAPKATVSMNIGKGNFALGETIEGTLTVTSQEEFIVDEIRVELLAFERLKPGGGFINDNVESQETRLYSMPAQNAQQTPSVEYSMYRGQVKVSPKFNVGVGFNQQFQFRINVPSNVGTTFQGMRRDGRWLQRGWFLKAVVAVGGRPDVDTRADISVSVPAPAAPQMPAAPAMPVLAAPSAPGAMSVQALQPQMPQASMPEPPKPMITCCSRCSAPLSPNQEDLIVTCRYCGFTISVATQEEVKNHSMLENHLLTQQAVEAAQNYMDKGIFRRNVSKDAQIANVKLRYIPFWTFPVNTATAYSGITGQGLQGEMNQVQDALTDKRASKLTKFGKLMKAGASAYMEMQQKDRKPTSVSLSFSNHYTWPILARRTMISEINYYDVPAARKIPFDVGKIQPDAEFLNTEFKQEEAKAKVRAEVEAKERLVACGKVDTLQSCNTNIAVGDGELVHAPIWFVQYSLSGENYMILVDGSEGKVLGGGRPLIKF